MTDPISVATRYYEALNRNDAKAAASLFHPGASVFVPGATLVGPEQFEAWMQAFFDAFPDITHDRTELVQSEDSITTELTVSGTHTGPLVSSEGTIPATNRPMTIHATNVMDVEADRIKSMSISFDQADFMDQLGVS